MKKYLISFLALSRSVDLEFESNSGENSFFIDLVTIFVESIDYDNFQIKINQLHQNTSDFRKKVDNYVQKYKDVDPKVHRLNSYFKDLKDDEYFFVLPTSATKEESFQFYNYLSALNSGEDFEVFSQEFEALFGAVRNNYVIVARDENTRNKIGQSDKSQRICRFCKRGPDKVTFKKVAHSISEALGNKKIITNDECDDCNQKFGTGIETDLISYLNLFRVIFNVKGKNGVPKLKGKNFEIENEGQIAIKHYLTEDELRDPNRDDTKMSLETTQDISAQNLYRTLVKYALSIIDADYLQYFSDTINWINGIKSIDKLPKVAMLRSYDLFSDHPKIIVYLRKSDNGDLPYAVAEFRFTFLVFVYIIPLSTKDSVDFTGSQSYKHYWDFFRHYSQALNWEFFKMDDDISRKFTMNINFKMRSDNTN